MQYRKIQELTKLPNNPRTIKDESFQKLCKSIQDNKDYFEARPLILSNRTGELVIIAGNQRYEAGKHLKLQEVPTYLMEGLTEEREKEIIIRDNVNNGEWDWAELKDNWDIEELEDWGLEWQEEVEVIEKEKIINDLSDTLKSKYIIEIECNSEAEQEILYNRFLQEKLKVRILSI